MHHRQLALLLFRNTVECKICAPITSGCYGFHCIMHLWETSHRNTYYLHIHVTYGMLEPRATPEKE